MSVLEDSLVKPLEQERAKFCTPGYKPTTRQLKRFSAFAKLYREDLSTSSLSSTTRARKSAAQKILIRIVRLSSSVLVLYCFCNSVTGLAKRSSLEIIPKLRAWWSSVEHPKLLEEYAKSICQDECIEDTEPPTSQASRSGLITADHSNAAPIPYPTALVDVSETLNDLTFLPPPEQRVFESASLQGIAIIFNQQVGSAIRRVTVQDELKAAVTTVFTTWAGTIDCLMSLAVSEWSVEWFGMALFNAELKWVNQVRHFVLREGVTLIIPNVETTFKGVTDEAIINVFGTEIYEAIIESPVRRKELEEGKRITECVSMMLTKDGAIINLALGIDGGVKIQNKLYT